ncbi:hypothetical protein [Xanthomonas citri]|uniref:hypothetical protein n=1 Tax=Xanthomonas citri TaxID=346 RepID=UPI0009B791C7|nr:hypothetical protein [Xanthomonas citri]QDS19373.1 hypothetical protein FPL05_06025 [Xanthomonas citri pv. glycines]QTK40146.1 hypothetical protein XcgCFBP7119R_05515 [Xanthomonas citri pv. glycines]
MDAIAQARNEIAVLDQKISELQARRAAFVQFVDMGTALFGKAVDQSHLPIPVKLPPLPAAKLPPLPPKKSLKDQVIEACFDELKDGFAQKPAALVRSLEARGIFIGGENKAMALSSMLSKDGRFIPNRKFGWSLRLIKSGPAPAGTGTGPGSTQGETPDADSSDDEL